jgi:ubiquinone/menaquinone biosynthesis C-methylase UbiE
MEIAIDRFTGFSALYNKVRPQPPSKICRLISDIAGQGRFDLVVDLGSGTGLSTAIWREFSKKLIGIEPNPEMRDEAHRTYTDIDFLEGSSYSIPLSSNSVDVVCCSQSFHWMEPTASLKEIDRVLKPDGLLVAYDCFWPITINPPAELAYIELFNRVHELTAKYEDRLPRETKWPKSEHRSNMKKSGYFSYVKETYMDNEELCDAERYIGIAYSQGQLQTLIKNKIVDINPHLEKFEKIVKENIRQEKTMWISYEVIIATKMAS